MLFGMVQSNGCGMYINRFSLVSIPTYYVFLNKNFFFFVLNKIKKLKFFLYTLFLPSCITMYSTLIEVITHQSRGTERSLNPPIGHSDR